MLGQKCEGQFCQRLQRFGCERIERLHVWRIPKAVNTMAGKKQRHTRIRHQNKWCTTGCTRKITHKLRGKGAERIRGQTCEELCLDWQGREAKRLVRNCTGTRKEKGSDKQELTDAEEVAERGQSEPRSAMCHVCGDWPNIQKFYPPGTREVTAASRAQAQQALLVCQIHKW